jgi:Uma2 family endonuclease
MARWKYRSGYHTFDDFRLLVRAGQRADLIDGVIHIASPESLAENDQHGWLVAILRPFVRRRALGRIFSSRVAVRLDDRNSPEPDVCFIRSERQELIRSSYLDGACDLAVEIVSHESVRRDYELKRSLYERFQVPEYWIVDQYEQTAMFLRLGSRGRYREVRPRRGIFRSEVVNGFWLRGDWLWQQPLPDELDTVQTILAGPASA